MARKGMTAKDAKEFTDKPVSKKKVRDAERKHDDDLGDKLSAKVGTKKREHENYNDPKAISSGALRGVMVETVVRCYEEMFPNMRTRDDQDRVDATISEEVYILGLTMVCGNENYKPRRGLKMREVEDFGESARYCREHR